MPAEIRIYFEGDRALKPGFNAFFRQLRESGCKKRCRLQLISAKSGEQAQRDFETALETHRDSWTILLRDSEGPLARNRARKHADRIFWMVEMMESWFHADKNALAKFYGDDFRASALKAVPNVESIAKGDLERRLRDATKSTKKGNYFDHKTSHGPQLLALIDPDLVRKSAPNCDRLFKAVLDQLS